MSRARQDRKVLTQALEHALRQATAQGTLFSQIVARHLGVNSTDLECLDIIGMRQPVTAGDLAVATGLTTGAVTGIIDRLEKAGFARREPDESDRRKIRVQLLPAVERRIAPLFEPMREVMNAAVEGYSEKQIALLLDFFDRTYRASVDATAALQRKTEPKRRGAK